MHQEFIIQTVETDLINKKIIVTTSMDIDPNSIDEIEASLYDRETREPISLVTEIKGNVLEFTLMEWPKPNNSYIFNLKPIRNILRELSRSGIKRKIEFKSSITKQVEILSPLMHEAINSLNVKFKTFDDTEVENEIENECVFIEVSTDNVFASVTNHISVTDRDEVRIHLNKSAQYFMRARVQSDTECGPWSKIITFVYGQPKIDDIQESEPDYIPEYEDMVDMTPEIDDIANFEITCLTEQGTTPEQIILLGNKDFDEDDFSQSQILVYSKKGVAKHTAIVDGNTIIIDFINGLSDNTVYTIKLMEIKSLSGDTLSLELKLTTAMKPLYCDVYDVTALIGDYKIPEDVILHNIHSASKFADYIVSSSDYPYEIDENDVPFNVVQFVKYYAAHECLLRHTVNLSSSIGLKGTVGNVNFSESESAKDITSLLKHFCAEIDKWKDALRGYEFEGRARMRHGVRGRYSYEPVQPLDIASQLLYGRGDMYGQ